MLGLQATNRVITETQILVLCVQIRWGAFGGVRRIVVAQSHSASRLFRLDEEFACVLGGGFKTAVVPARRVPDADDCHIKPNSMFK